MNIILIGFSGCGKTTVGKEISNITGMDFVDTDVLIERKLSLKIEDIFTYYGQRYFRFVEREVIKELHFLQNKVISTGGGAFLDPINIRNLKAIGMVFFLNASVDTILRKGIPPNRPLLKDEERSMIEKLYNRRMAFYKQADIELIVDDKTPSIIAKEIINIFCSYRKNYDNIKESFLRGE
ncbi:shikimate kinase [Lutispora sp.]|uniref:shikimate kinase n=1 Tax=Lutispora sp. TaxID=2828727 RepID=UPI003565DB0C